MVLDVDALCVVPSFIFIFCVLLSSLDLLCFASLCCYLLFAFYDKCYLSQCMGFPTVGYVRPAGPWISLRMRAVWSGPLLVA